MSFIKKIIATPFFFATMFIVFMFSLTVFFITRNEANVHKKEGTIRSASNCSYHVAGGSSGLEVNTYCLYVSEYKYDIDVFHFPESVAPEMRSASLIGKKAEILYYKGTNNITIFSFIDHTWDYFIASLSIDGKLIWKKEENDVFNNRNSIYFSIISFILSGVSLFYGVRESK